MRSFLSLCLVCATGQLFSQPVRVSDGILFTFHGSASQSVSLVGDFNGWSGSEDPMARDSSGSWRTVRPVNAGVYQYKFLIDGKDFRLDPDNPVSVDNYNHTSQNSVFCVTSSGEVELRSSVSIRPNPADNYSDDHTMKPLYLNIIWHQHQPLYLDPESDQLKGPWVRTHATKDYYDMAAMVGRYPDIHVTINLTSSLLMQLQRYYVDRLGPYVDPEKNTVDISGFWKKWKGKTDPWIDLALKATSEFDDADKSFLYRNAWNAFGISEVMIGRFPEYGELKKKLDVDQMPGFDILSEQEMREAKFWFYLAHFDPDFLRGPVKLPDGTVSDLSDLVREEEGEHFLLRKKVTEEDCVRMVAEAVKVMRNVIPIHKSLMFDPVSREGQIEVITTPYYHPILPLLYDTEIARTCQPADPLPPRFSFPEDARAQVARGVLLYRTLFGRDPNGMWPAEGAVAQEVLPILRNEGIMWAATDVKVLNRSTPPSMPNSTPYRLSVGAPGRDDESIVMVFRDTELSDRIGFRYQTYDPEVAAEDFVQSILSRRPTEGSPDALLTVILDGENAWEWYTKDMDGKHFLSALYRKLSKLFGDRVVITTTLSEYIAGNDARNIPAHPVEKLPALTRLHPGSWINANFDTWIGEREENDAWGYLLKARQDLEGSGLPGPDPYAGIPAEGTVPWFEYMAWEEIYAAEGSDWFWWYGNDQLSPSGDRPFDDAFRNHLKSMYRFMNLAGKKVQTPEFPSLIVSEQTTPGGGAMSPGGGEAAMVIFTCKAPTQAVESSLFITGNIKSLGEWNPNTIPLYDDGTHGDSAGGDGVWSVALSLPVGQEVEYKYTNSGTPGRWGPGDESPGRNRKIVVTAADGAPMVVRDTFGRIDQE